MQEHLLYTHFPSLPFQHGKHPDQQIQGYMSETSFKTLPVASGLTVLLTEPSKPLKSNVLPHVM